MALINVVKKECPWCGKSVADYEPKVVEGDGWYHVYCYTEEADSLVLVNVTRVPKPCDHEWDDDETCLKCGMSFVRYTHTECP